MARTGHPAEAGAKLSRAAELSPNDATLPLRAGLAFAEAGMLVDAEKSFRSALQRDPKFARASYNLGLLFAQTNQLTEAAKALAEAESIEPNTAEYPYALATVLYRLGDHHGTQEAARRVIRIDSTHSGARKLLDMPP